MRVRLISYSKNGRDTAERIAGALISLGHDCRRYALPKYQGKGDEPLMVKGPEWAGEAFREADALIFCCASGIAVRAIAPWVRDKTKDPAVIVIDDQGHFVIPLLSGHLGGANELALLISEKIGGTPVLTTATDVSGVFAVDLFAKKNHLVIGDMKLAKEVSASLLSGNPVGFCSELPCEGKLPKGLTEGAADLGIRISEKGGDTPFSRTLLLIPRRYAAGIGCRKGKSFEELSAFLSEQLKACGIRKEELRCIASIDLKKEEQGLITLCESLGVPFETYTAEQLRAVPGEFTGSDFVKATTGVDSVCERAAVLASGYGPLIQKKTAANGMTFALARYEEAIRFE